MTAAAEAVEGVYNNAAAPAVREPFSVKWFDYEPSAGISLPGGFARTDFSNRGENADSRTDNFIITDLGLQLQWGALGVSVVTDFLSYSFRGQDTSLGLQLGRIHACAAYAFLDHQLLLGAGVRGAYAIIRSDAPNATNPADRSSALVGMLGAGPEAGFIVKPNEYRWRIGATVRAAVDAGAVSLGNVLQIPQPDGSGVRTAGNLILPERITLPWEVEGGIAYQLGPRPLNPKWINPHEQGRELAASIAERRAERAAARAAELALTSDATPAERSERARRASELMREEVAARAAEDAELRDEERALLVARRARYENWPRPYLLLLASVLMTGPSAQAVALEGLLDQRRELVGTVVTASPRIAAESEVIPNLLRLRAGLYFEPSRFKDGSTRQHLTFGGDLKLFAWDLFGLVPDVTWRLKTFVDISPRYENFGVGLGAWH